MVGISSLTVGRVESPDGALYEATGIPADVFAASFPSSDIANNRDSGLDVAIEVLQD